MEQDHIDRCENAARKVGNLPDELFPEQETVRKLTLDDVNLLTDEFGNLDLSGVDEYIIELPDGLKVVGCLDLHNALIKRLPDGLKVGGCLDISDTCIDRFPDDMTVGGPLYACNTLISELPDGFKIRGSLGISGTPITRLPDDLTVGGALYARDCANLAYIGERVVVGRVAFITGSKITNIPDTFRVGLLLIARDCKMLKPCVVKRLQNGDGVPGRYLFDSAGLHVL